MPIVNRIFLAILICFAGVWVWATLKLQQQVESDKEFQQTQLNPVLDKSHAQSEAIQQTMSEKDQARKPLPRFEPIDMAVLAESIERMKLRHHYLNVQSLAEVGLMGTVLFWGVATQIRLAVERRRLESPDRPASKDAGCAIEELVKTGSVFVAKGSGMNQCSVTVDGQRAVVIFTNFSFVASFWRNPRKAFVELPFPDVLTAILHSDKGRLSLHLRTTLGRVMISDSVRPFDGLARLLLDVSELNRTSPAQYRAALAREPVVHTPWYGWLLIAMAIGAVSWLFWWVLKN